MVLAALMTGVLLPVTGAAASSRTAAAPAAVTNPERSVSSNLPGARGVSYTYRFKISSLLTSVTSVTMTVPPGTGGTPTVGPVTPTAFAGGTITLSDRTLTYAKKTGLQLLGATVSIQIAGLTNTPTAGTYSSTITTRNGTRTLGTGTTPPLTFAGPLSATSPASVTWAATLDGGDKPVVDTRPGDQQITVADDTGTGAGWHITASATTLTAGTHRLPNTGTLTVTGSVSSPAATTPPTASCVTTCTLPAAATTYPVRITTGSTPAPVTLYAASAGTGKGHLRLGGSGAASPWGWWVTVPGNAFAGSYTTTVTVTIVSGP